VIDILTFCDINQFKSQPFLEQVIKILKNIPNTVKTLLQQQRQLLGNMMLQHPKYGSSTASGTLQGRGTSPLMPSSGSTQGLSIGTFPSAGSSGETFLNQNHSVNGSNNGTALVGISGIPLVGIAPNTNTMSSLHLGGVHSTSGQDSVQIPAAVNNSQVSNIGSSGVAVVLTSPQFDNQSVGSKNISESSSVAESKSEEMELCSNETRPQAEENSSLVSSNLQGAPSNTINPELNRPSALANNDSGIRPSALPLPTFPKSIDSFKVLAECPLIVLLLFQLYPKYYVKYMTPLVPVMMMTLSQHSGYTEGPLKSRYRELLVAQVCLNF
jgi:hypothetical protein